MLKFEIIQSSVVGKLVLSDSWLVSNTLFTAWDRDGWLKFGWTKTIVQDTTSFRNVSRSRILNGLEWQVHWWRYETEYKKKTNILIFPIFKRIKKEKSEICYWLLTDGLTSCKWRALFIFNVEVFSSVACKKAIMERLLDYLIPNIPSFKNHIKIYCRWRKTFYVIVIKPFCN